ncbi:lysylphosphatidylglycerol synthase transmembrane domain-containing protein [Nocardiopsis sp. N85]|uniref:lysylphosphatidylglycerol synthase transmembrane domain-containing protein n=1 Tax=Nocardiopsis sp. N85 TaxID=3029400 RepID=UPI00237F4A58|nr:lysylphosphatidylglycerol synthase transmembrane domain-containing protein [Nocardiopsis sp. N85]MDE3724196.1 lysylphosphatidylglycerol synthase transmembrane domain-containing protein [Nocardiopsis sp. N85]
MNRPPRPRTGDDAAPRRAGPMASTVIEEDARPGAHGHRGPRRSAGRDGGGWARGHGGALTRTLIGAAILGWVLWWYPLEAFTAAFAVVDAGAVATALGVGAATTVLCAARWRVIARAVGLSLSPVRAVSDYYLALFLNAVLPAGVLGDAYRAVGHGRANGDLGRGVRAVVLERVAGQVVLTVAVAALIFVLPATLWGPGWGAVALPLALVAVAGAAVAVGARSPRARGSRAGRVLVATARDVRVGLVGRAPTVIVLSAAALVGHVALFLLAAHLVGVDAPPTRLVPLAVLALAAMSVPVNVGGWGPREVATAAAFGAAGLGAEQGLTVSVVYGLFALVAASPGAAVLVARLFQGGQVSGGPIREEREQEPALGGVRP